MPWTQRLSTLKTRPAQSLWTGSPNQWVRELSNFAKGDLAVNAYIGAFSGSKVTNNSVGYDIAHGALKIEAKLSSRSFSGTNAFVWNQVRPQDPYTHLWLLAVEPSAVRAFLVPRDAAQPYLVKQHGIGTEGGNTWQIKTSSSNVLPSWLLGHERKPP